MAAESPTNSPLLLGSGSPRRRALITALGVAFEVATADIDERSLVSDDLLGTVQRIARAKFDALAALPEHAGRRMLTADTLVASGGKVLGKPSDSADARTMVQSMSGHTIDISTAVCVGTPGSDPATDLVTTTVLLHELSEQQVEDYLATGAAMDKAGALELQGAASGFIAAVEGCWSNVVGLPICSVAALLEDEPPAGRQRCSGRRCGAGHG